MNSFIGFLFLLPLAALLSSAPKVDIAAEDSHRPTADILRKVDELKGSVEERIDEFSLIASIDHHRLAKKEGAYTPPAIALVFSDPKINAELLSNSKQLVGLDLPFKLLCFSEADTSSAKIAFTSGQFIAKRHGLPIQSLEAYQEKLNEALSSFDQSVISESNVESVTQGYGIIKIKSNYDFENTLARLHKVINAQTDTQWFGETDYQEDARKFGKELNPTKLLLFGAPAPGAQAMNSTPKIGLDAFCQKLLVYEMTNGEVWIAFNDIVDFSQLYYGTSTKPQQMINQRLKDTFTKVVQ